MKTTVKNISIITLGCSKNEIDSELINAIVRREDFIITDSLAEADIIIINTCGFIKDAKEESIRAIWEATRYKEEGRCRFIILAGCLAERYSAELLEEIEAVDAAIGTGNVKDIIPVIIDLLDGRKKIERVRNVNEKYLENINRLDFAPSKYIRVSEGCNNFCTYCIIPKLRGKHRSRRIEDIIGEVEYLVENGVREIILIGQNITDYGIDLYGDYRLYELLNRLNEIDQLKWIRLHYLYPDNITKKLISSIKNNTKVLKYLDIPLQHISSGILKKMNRKTCRDDIIGLISNLREEIPNLVIRTTFMVGFPGETEEDFK
ncbi:MAG: 30S ribosomal protein S12 methylthiotransferase RimO, partial [Tissierellia bacterium]|nr:30S ribosomal protein S12 methylthiotransferase RimO [Tissierellia bacterium]